MNSQQNAAIASLSSEYECNVIAIVIETRACKYFNVYIGFNGLKLHIYANGNIIWKIVHKKLTTEINCYIYNL